MTGYIPSIAARRLAASFWARSIDASKHSATNATRFILCREINMPVQLRNFA
jgi:hypothetical protein